MEPSCGLAAESTNYRSDPRSGVFGVVHGARGFPRKPLSLGARGFGTVGMGGWSKTLVAGILGCRAGRCVPLSEKYDGSGFRTVSITPPQVILSTLVLGTQNIKHPT